MAVMLAAPFMDALRADCTKQRLELTLWLTWGIPQGAARERLTYRIPQVNHKVNSNLRLVQLALSMQSIC
jgi:hypothetical protein